MRKPPVLHQGAGSLLGFICIAIACLAPLQAQNVAQNQILQNKMDEQDVRLHTASVVAQIQGLIDELTANGISGDDIKVLSATKAALTHLSGPEMDQVLASLQKAGAASDPASSQQNALNAYADQKGIILEFRQILKDYEQRQAAYELPVRFKELADRQTETLLTSANVARATAGKSASELTGMQQTTEQIAQADQEAIANDANLAAEQLKKAAQDSTDDDAKTMQQAQKDMLSGVLQQALTQANDDLKAGQLLKAIQQQQIARDELRHIAQDLNPAANAVDALASTAAALAKLIEKQKSLQGQTQAAVGVSPPITGLDDVQAALVDETNTLQQDMQSLSATAAGVVKDAIQPMQVSRAALGQNSANATEMTRGMQAQQQAIDKLEEAQKDLQQQLADAQKAADAAAQDPVAKLQDLQKQIQAAMQQQQQLTNQTTQAARATPPDPNATAQNQQQQSQLQQQAANLQQTAQPLSLPASQALANAASQMNQAQQDLTNPAQAANAPAAQLAAQAALAQANQQVGQQIAQAQQQAPDPSALAAAANALQQAQNSVSSAITDATPPPSSTAPPSMAKAAAALAAAAQDTKAAAATPGLPGSAAAAVQQAQASIAQGQQQAAKGDAEGTAHSAAAAEQALAQAQATVAMAQAGMAGAVATAPGTPGTMPGREPGPPTPGAPSSNPATGLTGGSTAKGTLQDLTGNGKFVSVASRDRAAIEQTQQENRPQEYAPMIDQYMKNLADQSSSSSP